MAKNIRINIDFDIGGLKKLVKNLDIDKINEKVKQTLNGEARRVVNYAKDHHRMTYRDDTGDLTGAISSFPIRKLRIIDGYRKAIGIADKPRKDDVSPVQKYRWLIEGTKSVIRPTRHDYLQWEAVRPHAPGNFDKGKFWRLKEVTGIEARGDFLQNALSRTRKAREAAFAKIRDDIIRGL